MIMRLCEASTPACPAARNFRKATGPSASSGTGGNWLPLERGTPPLFSFLLTPQLRKKNASLKSGRKILCPVRSACSFQYLRIVFQVRRGRLHVCQWPEDVYIQVVFAHALDDGLSVWTFSEVPVINLIQIAVLVFPSSLAERLSIVLFKLL